MQTIYFFSIGLVAIAESWLQPWLTISGIALPLTFAALFIVQTKVSSNIVPWLGLCCGIVLDFANAHSFGTNALYYLCTCWIVARLFPDSPYKKRAWVMVAVFSLAALLQPIYIHLVNQPTGLDLEYILGQSLFRCGEVVVITGVMAAVLYRERAAKI